MTLFSDQEERLVRFLKQHRPLPPHLSPGLEDRLMTCIRLERRESTDRSSRWQWGIPWAIAAGAVMVWGGSQWLQPKPQMVANSEEIEEFLVNNWREMLFYSSSTVSVSPNSFYSTYSTEWTTLTEPRTVLVESRR